MEATSLPDILTVKEAARVMRCNPKSVLNAIHCAGLPARRIGSRAFRIRREALFSWLEGHGRKR